MRLEWILHPRLVLDTAWILCLCTNYFIQLVFWMLNLMVIFYDASYLLLRKDELLQGILKMLLQGTFYRSSCFKEYWKCCFVLDYPLNLLIFQLKLLKHFLLCWLWYFMREISFWMQIRRIPRCWRTWKEIGISSKNINIWLLRSPVFLNVQIVIYNIAIQRLYYWHLIITKFMRLCLDIKN